MFTPSHYKMAYAKTEKLYNEKTLEIQNIDFSVKAKKQRKLSVDLKVLGSHWNLVLNSMIIMIILVLGLNRMVIFYP